MAESTRVAGDRVFCHSCEHEWDRAHGGLQCPSCESEFVEILDEQNSSPHEDSLAQSLPTFPRSPHPALDTLHDHNPWAPDPEEDDITTVEFNTGGGRGTFSFTSRTFVYPPNSRTRPDHAAEEVGRNFESMLAGMLGGPHRRSTHITGGGVFQFPSPQRRVFGDGPPNQPPDLFSLLFPSLPGARPQNRPTGALDLLGMLMNPANIRHGDAVFSQEDFDRVMTQLMEQNNGSGAPPASDAAINALKKKLVDESMLGNEGQAECSICMDNVNIGDEVTVLPCNHWFHGECITSWLKEHDTCPHCRKPITSSDNTTQTQTPPARPARRSSSVGSPLETSQTEPAGYGPQIMDSPGGLRDARRRDYEDFHGANIERPRSERQHGSRSNRGSDGSGGVGGWIRNHMPF